MTTFLALSVKKLSTCTVIILFNDMSLVEFYSTLLVRPDQIVY